jgi:type IV secretory pathway component VirB8
MSDKDLNHNNQSTIDEDEVRHEYNEFIKKNVLSGQYFKDGHDWYIFRYVTPICDRAILFIAILILFIVIYTVKIMGDSLFPLVVSQPIFISPKDSTIYQTKIVKLKPRKGEKDFDYEVQTFDESILKYLISNYIINREGFDFKDAKIEDVNKKFSFIKSNSTFREYKNFQSIMSKDNKNSPIHNFGKNVDKSVTIDFIKFKRKEGKNVFEKALFFIANSIPLDAEIEFTTLIKSTNDLGDTKKKYEKYLVRIKYDYQPIFKNDNQSTIGFTVTQYTLYKVRDI